MKKALVADVAIDPRTGGADAIYTYLAEPSLSVGAAAFVPLSNRSILGFVVAIYEATEESLGFPLEKLRPITSEVLGLSIPSPMLDLSRFIAGEYLCSLPAALAPCIPPGVKDRLVTVWSLSSQTADHKLSPLQEEVLRTIRDLGGELIEQKTKPLAASSQRALKLLRGKGLVQQVIRIAPVSERRRSETLLRLTANQAKIDAFLVDEGKKKPAQAVTLMCLQGAAIATFTVAEIKALAQVTEATIKALTNAGLLEPTDEWSATTFQPPVPNLYQSVAIEAIVNAIETEVPRGFLLYGVTGSGKTEVYLRAAADALVRGKQVLYLVPEIALAAQAIALLRARFGNNVTILHSELSPVERLQNWLKIREGRAGVVLGARSAAFAPIENLGLIIIDEEHESGYKQETVPRYHARTLARFLSERHSCPFVLGSATPSVESFYEAEQSEHGSHGIQLLSLPERTALARLPEVHIEDLTLGYRKGQPAMITAELERRIGEALELGQQIILFLNRRAYAPFLICRDCGFRYECPNCTVSLSFHQREGRLRCHHCGYQARPSENCPNCHGLRVNPLGVGTERVEEAVGRMFPDSKVARLDRDIARKKGALEEVLANFRSGDVDILVGTQMVAKGLDFPNVTLVGVIAADVSLNIPDFRSSERTFQLLSQVAGRAGRGEMPGSVVIQTFNPNHPAVQAAAQHEYLPFYEDLKRERLEAGYPPFRKLVNILLSGENRSAVIGATNEIRQLLVSRGIEALGPVDCAVERLQNRWRRHLLVKLPAGASAQPISAALKGFAPANVQVVLDVDPYSLM